MTIDQKTERISAGGLQVAKTLYDFVNGEVLPRVGKDSAEDQKQFWDGFGKIVEDFTPRNRELLAKRDEFQQKLDDWYSNHAGEQNAEEYTAFLKEIGYLVDAPADFKINTENIDTEISETAGRSWSFQSLMPVSRLTLPMLVGDLCMTPCTARMLFLKRTAQRRALAITRSVATRSSLGPVISLTAQCLWNPAPIRMSPSTR